MKTVAYILNVKPSTYTPELQSAPTQDTSLSMESLLRWSVTNTDPNAPSPDPERLRQLDPGILDQILGKSDAQLMKESAEKALDESQPLSSRITALEDLEMVPCSDSDC
jgi:hypothetical protein